MSYSRPVNLSKDLLIRAVGMMVLLAVVYKLQLLTEETAPAADAADVSNRDIPICDVYNPEVPESQVFTPISIPLFH